MNYYIKTDNAVELTSEGEYALAYLGLSLSDIKAMTKEQLVAHCKKFSDVLDDGREHKRGGSFFEGELGQNYSFNPMGKVRVNTNAIDGDSGSFSRYFSLDQWAQRTFPFLIVPKASKAEKNRGCEGIQPQAKPLMGEFGENPGRATPKSSPTPRTNYHPTCKPLKLMSYLITLGSREGDMVLDPFVGSGTTCLAAKMLNRKSLGFEIDEGYCEIAAKRCSHDIQPTMGGL